MSLTEITEGISYFDSAVNIGYVRKGETGLLIDSGIDKQAVKKIVKIIEEKNWPAFPLIYYTCPCGSLRGSSFCARKILAGNMGAVS
ncbi:hypothetical protein U0355_10770 [Salimicrobium sp. PL1-032A]|uniref:hypothetical protein n=1 Tax=Salimicrobium sp. PL1-032A TaxID=3095364 RepID=UPI003260D7B9